VWHKKVSNKNTAAFVVMMEAVTMTKIITGPIATKMPRIRGLRTVKKEILKLIDTFVLKADDLDAVNNDIVPALLDAVLVDYKQSVPDARDPEVLNVMSTIIGKLHVSIRSLSTSFKILTCDSL